MIILFPCKSIECFLQSVSAISLSRYALFLIPSLLICNKLSNEGSAIFVAQVLLLELLKMAKTLEDICSNGYEVDFSKIRTNVRSNKCPFEQMS